MTFAGYLILILGIVNILRMAVYMILGDWYDFFLQKRISEKYSRKSSYKPIVSVVIAAHNEEKSIERTLASIVLSSYSHLEIIVVDDGSVDATSQKVQQFTLHNPSSQITLLTQPNGGKARALNRGIRRAARGSLIMTLDADSLLDKYAIERAVSYFRNPRIKALASNVRIIKSNTLLGLIQYIEYLIGYRLKKSYSMLQMEYIIGGIGSMFRKSILKKVHWYDTDTVTEDIDLTMKIIKEGNKKNIVLYGPDVLTYTQPVESFGDLLKQRFRWKFGRFQTLFKNKNLFFHKSEIHTKLLTYFQLPFVLFSELTFLLDPLCLGIIFYVSYIYQDLISLKWIFCFYAFHTGVTVISDSYTSPAEKTKLFVLAPLSYIFFFAISVVEYIALWKCIAGVKGILNARKLDTCSWEHVGRSPAYQQTV